VKKELDKILTKVLESVSDQDTKATETKFMIDRIDRMYERMKVDICRHETVCFELANKFEDQYEVINAMSSNLETLKTYAMLNDLHIEAYQPI
jgi:hypothetical protein